MKMQRYEFVSKMRNAIRSKMESMGVNRLSNCFVRVIGWHKGEFDVTIRWDEPSENGWYYIGAPCNVNDCISYYANCYEIR